MCTLTNVRILIVLLATRFLYSIRTLVYFFLSTTKQNMAACKDNSCVASFEEQRVSGASFLDLHDEDLREVACYTKWTMSFSCSETLQKRK